MHHVSQVLEIPLSHVHTWTNSTIVLNWLDGNPRRFKTFVGNRVSTIMQLIPPEKWNHVSSIDNPADCAREDSFRLSSCNTSYGGMDPHGSSNPLPIGPDGRLYPQTNYLKKREVTLFVSATHQSPVLPFDHCSSYTSLKCITAWIFRFISNCQKHASQGKDLFPLSIQELLEAEHYWIKIIQRTYFSEEIECLSQQISLNPSSPLLPLHPLVDSAGLLCVGSRQRLSKTAYESKNPAILSGKHPLTRIIIYIEHLRLLHAGPTLLSVSLLQRYHILGGRSVIRSTARGCVTCRRQAAKPRPEVLGQLPIERVTPGPVFGKVGVDCAGPVLIKYGYVRKPTIIKTYICVFVSLTVKAVHLELVSNLSSDAFIASLRRFISRRGIPSLIWSDHGTNFVGAARELKELYHFLQDHTTQYCIMDFLTTQNITWKFIPQHAPHFGGLWEAAVKSLKTHLRKVVGDVKLTFEEMTTLLTQIEVCLNSRPLVPLPGDDDGVEALTPGHFLIGQPLQALPDLSFTYLEPLSSLRLWRLCQA